VPEVNSCCTNEQFLQQPIRVMSLQRLSFNIETEYVQGRRFLRYPSSVMRRRQLQENASDVSEGPFDLVFKVGE
jgi:hypothetical protein